MKATSTSSGRFVPCTASGSVPYRAFVPNQLPPRLSLERFYPLLDKANFALGGLNALDTLLPDPSLFIYMYVRKEAVLSSQIEGTQSSLSDLLLHESNKAPGVPIDDAAEVSNYIHALGYGLKQLKTIPLSLRLIKGVHKKLMYRVRGNNARPGEFRTSQNWIGGTRPSEARFVPPPPNELGGCLDAFETFLHDDDKHPLPVLVRAAMAHAQFETIHPFLDGNGRVGRMLIALLLCKEGMLDKPLLYLSLYLKKHRARYYDLLQNTRDKGDWQAWVQFFLQGVLETAQQAVTTAVKINRLFDADQRKIAQETTASVLSVYRPFQEKVIADTTTIVKGCRETYRTVLRHLQTLEKMGIIKEMKGHRPKMFVYKKYLDILNEDIGGK
ncbi:MAG: Fic family protein [Alphaproteobacteria bacterium GM202ARS2]|nr:Fic family protein [Alphaproteobacteria bacterium GM202ARS2]